MTPSQPLPKPEAVKAATEWFGGDELAASVYVSKYALTDPETDLVLEPTPDLMHRRLAREFARIEARYPNPLSEDEIYDRLKGFKRVIPQGSPMSAVGNPYSVQSLGNCFVLPNLGDSYGSILQHDEQLVQLAKRRAGVGMDLSALRPEGTPVRNAARSSTGVVSFMERFSNSIREVAQSGRRGALLLSLSVYHPDIEKFITSKRDSTKVTGANISVKVSEEFMRAVIEDREYEQRFPVEGSGPKLVSRMVSARKVWNLITENAWFSGDPGMFFWDRACDYSPAHCYGENHPDFKNLSSNPCVTGETLIYTADGRRGVPIKDLAQAGDDVPVFCLNNRGRVEVRVMRNPRVTGVQVPVWKVTLDDGSVLRTTGEHKLRLVDGSYKEVQNLQPGDGLYLVTQKEGSIKDVFRGANSNSQDYMWLSVDAGGAVKSEHRLIAEHYFNAKIPHGFVVHHKDFNAQNNVPENLQVMSTSAHLAIHREGMLGDRNPMRRAATEWSSEKWESYRGKHSRNNTAEGNSRYCGATNEELRDHARALTANLGRRFSVKEWQSYAKENRLPMSFSKWRKDHLGGITGLAKMAAASLGMTNQVAGDPRQLRSLQRLTNLGYECSISDNHVWIHKVCECCGVKFVVDQHQREAGLCGVECSKRMKWTDRAFAARRQASLLATQTEKHTRVRSQQRLVYRDLQTALGRIPMKKEWIAECIARGVSSENGRRSSPYKTWHDLQVAAVEHNHRVVSVIQDGVEDVYNGTVDEFHNFLSGGFSSLQENGKRRWSWFCNRQCGEIIMGVDSCRLLLLNTLGYVKDPFLATAEFDWEKFESDARVGHRLMDDLVDMELEAIDRILAKVASDPEDEDTKGTERRMWERFRENARLGRRTGLGLTAVADALAAVGLKYDSPEAVEFVDRVYTTLCLGSMRESVSLARERGSFPIWSRKTEEGNQFLDRVWGLDPQLFEDYLRWGRRNIASLTTAPCGSVSIVAQTSSGIEPVFRLSYTRRKKLNPGDSQESADLVDNTGERWKEFEVFHHGLQRWMDATGETDVTKSPYHKQTSAEIDWRVSVDIQAAAQRSIDHSISKTHNLPREVSPEVVADLYMRSYLQGNKGVTVYREGSKTGVLVSKEEKESQNSKTGLQDRHAPKRPKVLPCDIHQVQVQGEKWIVFVGLLDGKPYEVMGGLRNKVIIPRKCKEGRIQKHNGADHPKARYDLHFGEDPEDETIIQDIANVWENPTHAAFTRTLSLALRHGTPVQYVVEQLVKGSEKEDDMWSFSRVLSRVLKTYIQDGTKLDSTKTCKECGVQGSLVYQEGCQSCTSCGWSKCS